MKVIEEGSINGPCGGMSYEFRVEYEGDTVVDVLEEIKEYTNSEMCFGMINGYGKNPDWFGTAWGIYIDGKTYLSLWNGEEKTYKGDCTEKVKSIEGSGGWCCGINFYITTEAKNDGEL